MLGNDSNSFVKIVPFHNSFLSKFETGWKIKACMVSAGPSEN